MRPVFLLFGTDMGGAERQALGLARTMQRLGHDPVIASFDESGPVKNEAESFNIEYRMIYGRLWSIPNWFKIALSVRKLNADCLLPYSIMLNVICGMTWKLTGAKTIIWNQRSAGTDLTPALSTHLALRNVPWIFSNSREGANVLIDELNVNPDRIRIIRNGVQLPQPQDTKPAWRTRLGITNEVQAVGMLANIQYWKDHQTLLCAWAQIESNLRKNAKLILAGNKGDTWPAVEKLILELNLKESVVVCERIDDVSGFLSAMDISVLCSKTEGTPNSLIESMMIGLPVVATAPECQWIVGDDQMSNVSDIKMLTGKLSELLRDPLLRSERGNHNKIRAHELFDATKNFELHANMIEAIALGETPDRPFELDLN